MPHYALKALLILLISAHALNSNAEQDHSQRRDNPAQWRSHQMNQPKSRASERYRISRDRIDEIRLLLKEAEKEIIKKKAKD
jgi:hypothetical protein